MSKKIETGGPAFPQFNGGGANGGFLPWEEGTERAGMTLRDYFAAAALSGGLEQGTRDDMDCNWWHEPKLIAMRAYAIAAAMLAARGVK